MNTQRVLFNIEDTHVLITLQNRYAHNNEVGQSAESAMRAKGAARAARGGGQQVGTCALLDPHACAQQPGGAERGVSHGRCTQRERHAQPEEEAIRSAHAHYWIHTHSHNNQVESATAGARKGSGTRSQRRRPSG